MNREAVARELLKLARELVGNKMGRVKWAKEYEDAYDQHMDGQDIMTDFAKSAGRKFDTIEWWDVKADNIGRNEYRGNWEVFLKFDMGYKSLHVSAYYEDHKLSKGGEVGVSWWRPNTGSEKWLSVKGNQGLKRFLEKDVIDALKKMQEDSR